MSERILLGKVDKSRYIGKMIMLTCPETGCWQVGIRHPVSGFLLTLSILFFAIFSWGPDPLFAQDIFDRIKESEVISGPDTTKEEVKTKADSLEVEEEEAKKSLPSPTVIKARIQKIQDELDTSYEAKKQFTKEVEKHYLDYIKKYPNSPFVADAYFHLANLSFELYPHYEYYTYVKILNYYRKLLKIKPDYKHKDVVYYNMAFCNYQKEKIRIEEKRLKHPELLGHDCPDSLRLLKSNLRKSIEYYEKIRTEFPNSDFYFEAIYRLGDIYFDLAAETGSSEQRKKYLLIAENYYKMLIPEESDLLEESIYKLGWTYFSMNKYNPAIVRFIGLLNDITLNDSTAKSTTIPEVKEKAEKFVEGARIFEYETLEYVASSFAGFDSTNYTPNPIGTEKFKKIISKIGSEIYAKRILERLGDIYAEIDPLDAWAKARATYTTFLDLFPLNENNPTIANKIVTSYINAYEYDKAEEEKERLALRFTASSEWYQKYKDNEKVMKKELPIIKEAYEYTIGIAVNEAMDRKEKTKYEKAIKFSELYLELFPTSEKSQEIESNLAQMYFDLAEQEKDIAYYYKAIDKFQSFNEKFVDSPTRYDNAYNIIVAYQSILDITKKEEPKEEKPAISVTDTLTQDTLSIIPEMTTEQKLLSACTNYRKLFSDKISPTAKDSLTLYAVLQLQADIYYDEKNYADALPIFKEIVNNFVPICGQEKKTEYTYNIGVCYKHLGDYVSSEEWFKQAETLAVKTENKEIKESARTLALESVQNQAAELEKNDDYIGAAEQYERIAKQDLKAEYSFDNMLKSAELYEKANDFENAIRVYLFIAENYKDMDKDTQILPAYNRAAAIVDSFLQDYEREISIYQRVVDRYPDTEDARDYELRIITIYDNKIGDKEFASNKYIEFAKKYKDWPKAPYVFDNAIANYEELGDTEKVIQLCLEFVRVFPTDPSALNKLQRVLKEYIDMDRWDKAEEIAIQIKQRFPEQESIVATVSKAILDKIEVEIDSLYENENYTDLSAKIKEYRNKDKYFRDKNINLNLDPEYAKLRFYDGEIVFNDIMQDSVKKTISRRRWVKEVKRLVNKRKNANKIYLSLKDYNIPKWTTAGLHRLGQIDEYLFIEINKAAERFSNVYKDPIDGEAFLNAVNSGYIEPFYNSTITYFSTNYKILEDNGIENEWTLASRDKLYEYGILQKPEEGYKYLTIVTNSDWKYSNTYQEGFSKLDFVDSLSLFTSPQLVSLDTLGIDSLAADVDTTAQFIWGSDKDTTLYFRKVFEIQGVPEIARLTLISPNETYIFINGKIYQELYTNDIEKIKEEDWQSGKTRSITDKLNTGENIIAVQAKCDTNTVYKGLLVSLKITARLEEGEEIHYEVPQEEAEVTIIPVDTTYYTNHYWLVNTEVEDGWYYFGYNDSLWSGSAIIPTDSLSLLPEFPGSISKVIWDSLLSDTVYFRYKFTAPDSIELVELKIAVDTIFSIYVNGDEIAKEETNPRIAGKYEPRIFDITNSVTTGGNVIAIKAIANRITFGMIAEIHLVGVIKKHAFLIIPGSDN